MKQILTKYTKDSKYKTHFSEKQTEYREINEYYKGLADRHEANLDYLYEMGIINYEM